MQHERFIVPEHSHFKYLYDQPKDQKEYAALGSKQRVKVRKSFRRKAKKAYDLACEAIDTTSEKREEVERPTEKTATTSE